MKLVAVVAVLVLGAAGAVAQPIDPYGDGPAPAPGPTLPPSLDPDLEVDESVAQGLVARAGVLETDGRFAEAKQLVVEALTRRKDGPTAAEAKLRLSRLNARLGIVDRPVAPPPAPIAPPPYVQPPFLDALDEPPARERPFEPGHDAMLGYGVLAGAALGAMVSGVDDAAPTIGLTLAGGAAGGVALRWYARQRGYSRADAHLVGSGVLWGGLAGAAFADVASGLEDTDAGDLAVGAGLGAVGGMLVGAALRNDDLTVGDAALIDSVALWGTEAAVAFAFAIAPPETEAYTLNATLGAAGGYLIGHLAARNREVTAGRLARVNAVAALGAAAPWLLYAVVSDDTVDDDEQAFGWLSLAGLGAGIYFGFRWTSDPADRRTVDDAPAAVVRRGSDGGWSVGGPVIAPVRTDGRNTGVAATVLAGAW